MGLAAGAAIGAVGAIGSAAIGSSAAGNAAQAQEQAANTAAQTQLQMYQQTRSDLTPYMSYGNNAFTQLANIFGFNGGNNGSTLPKATVGGAGQSINIPGVGSITIPGYSAGSTPLASGATGQPNPQLATQLLAQFPGYQFGLDQGTQALDRSAAARGLSLSGAQLKDAQTFGQQYAMQNAWQPYISQLTNAASLGENAAAGAGNLGATAAAGAAQSQLAGGQASAAGSVAQGNIWGSALNQFGNTLTNLPLGSFGVVTPTSGLTSSAGDTIAANGAIF